MSRRRRTLIALLTSTILLTSGLVLWPSEVAAQTIKLDHDIDLTLNPIFLFRQNDPLWSWFPVGPERPDGTRAPMWRCGSLIAMLATLMDSYVRAAGSLPKFPVFIGPPPPEGQLFIGESVLEFVPPYVDQFLNDNDEYKSAVVNECGPGVRPHALVTSANPVILTDPLTGQTTVTPTGLVLAMSDGAFSGKAVGLGLSSASKDYINQNLLGQNFAAFPHPTLVRAITPDFKAYYWALIVGWDNTRQAYRVLFGTQLGDRSIVPGADRDAYELWESRVVALIGFDLIASLHRPLGWVFEDDPTPVNILVISPDGRRTGVDPGTRSFLAQDRSVLIYETGGEADPLGEVPPGDPQKFVGVLDPAQGTYRFLFTGTGNGPLKLSFRSVTENAATTLLTVNSVIATGQARKFEAQLSSAGSTTIAEVPTFTPEARAGRDMQGVVGVPIGFDGRQSVDYDGTIVAYAWDFGDGSTATGAQATHSYGVGGVFTVRLTVTDDQAATGTASVQATVIDPLGIVPPTTERVSVSSTGAQAIVPAPFNLNPTRGVISADGKVVAFSSRAGNLVTGDTNGVADIFVHNRQTGVTERVNVSSAGDQDASSIDVNPSFAISGNGRFVAFSSIGGNLAQPPVFTPLFELYSQVYVRDLVAGTTEVVSISSTGEGGTGSSFHPSISAGGRFVAFTSRAANLVPNDTNGVADIFVRDRVSGTTQRVNVSSAGTQSNAPNDAPLTFQDGPCTAVGPCSSDFPAISADGRFVAFASVANNLVPNDTNTAFDIFVHDRQTGTTERVNLSSTGEQDNAPPPVASPSVAISADGRFVAFTSLSSNLVPGHVNGYPGDVFVRDRLTNTTERVSVSSTGVQADGPSSHPSISGDGRVVAFQASASNLVPGGSFQDDVFVRDRLAGTTELLVPPFVRPTGVFPANADLPSISADGRFVSFTSLSFDLVPNDTNNAWDVFVRDRGARPLPVADPSGRYLGWASSPGQPAFITFDASGSVDPTGNLLTARWDFGDGSPTVTASTATPVTHAYSAAGSYTVTLIVSNGQDSSAPATTTADVRPPLIGSTTALLRTCGAPGTRVGLEIGPFPLLNAAGGWNVGRMGPLPVIHTIADAVPAGLVTVLFSGPSSGIVDLPVEAVSQPSPIEFALRATWTTPAVSTPGTYLVRNAAGGLAPGTFTTPCPPAVNLPPVANAGGPYVGTVGQPVRFNGSGSRDPEGAPLSYFWDFGDGGTGAGVAPQHAYAARGTYLVALSVNDGVLDSIPAPEGGTRGFAKVTITAVTNRPPICQAAAPTVTVLWPPDHRLVPIQIRGVTDPDGDPVTIRITGVTQDEPVNGLGDGDTSPDAVIQGTQVFLRAERSGQGNGRVYAVAFTADDGRGGTCTGAVKVSVPHSMKPGTSAIDDGQRYDSTHR